LPGGLPASENRLIYIVSVRAARNRVDDRSAGPKDGAWSNAGRFKTTLSNDMENGLAACDQVINNDAAVTPPPNRFGTHDHGAPFAPFFKKMRETYVKLCGKRVIGIVMEALVRPKAFLITPERQPV